MIGVVWRKIANQQQVMMLVVRDLEGGSASPVAGPAPEPGSSAPGPATRKKSAVIAGKARSTASRLRIPAKKGSW